VLFTASVAAQPPAKSAVKPDAPASEDGPQNALPDVHYLSQQVLGKGISQARLSNGMTVLVQENHAAPVATVRCFIHNTGSAFEGEHLGAGLSHLLEHLVAGGTTTKRSETEIREILDSLGGRTNAYTSDDVTAFYIDCPAKKVAAAINLVAENMQFSVIPEKEYRREMGVVQRELEMGESERPRVLHNTMKQLIFTEHPVRHPTIGYSAVVQQVERQQVIDFYHERYVPQNMLFIVAGDVRTDAVLEDVLQNFKQFQRTTERRVTLPDEPLQASPRSMRLEMEGPTTHYSVAWPTVPLQNPDLYPLDVASFILTNGDSARLTRKLTVDRPLATSVTSASYTPGFVKGWFEITAECEPNNLQTVADTILEEIERLQSEPVSAAELAKAKRQKSAEHVFGQQTVQNQAEMLASSYLSTGDALFDDRYVAGIQEVTPEQIQAVARKYFLPQRRNVLRIDPLGSKQQKSTDKQPQTAESPMILKKLPNGLTVLLKRHAVVPMVSIQAFAKAGAVTDTSATSGLASLACEMMVKGTKKYTAEQIAEYFDGIGGSFAVSSQRNSSYLQCSVLKENLDPSLNYASEVLFQPTFPEDEFEKVKSLQLSRIAARSANPQAEIMDFWASKLPESSPYRLTVAGTVKSVSKLNVADCRRFQQTYFVPQNMVLAVVGDIDVDATLKKIEATFGKAPRGKDLTWPKYPEGTPLAADVLEHLQNQKQNTAMVLLGFPSVSIYDHESRAALEMLEGLLTGGGGAGGRLHEELRGERLVYYVFGFQVTGFAPGYFNFLAQTRPESVTEVVRRIRANLQKIGDEGIPQDEFDKAKAMLLAAHALQNTTAAEQAFQAALDELYGLGYDYERKYDERIQKVTVADVQKIAKKFFLKGVIATSSPPLSGDSKTE
jgi:zinc protease